MKATVAVPSQWQTWRVDVHDAVLAMQAAFMAAVPGVIRADWHNLPETLTGEGPFTYIGRLDEQVVHDSGTRQTVFTGYFGYVDVLVEPRETDDRVNRFFDYMRDLCTANARMLPPGIFEQTGVAEQELHQYHVPMTDARVLWRFTVLEGRS